MQVSLKFSKIGLLKVISRKKIVIAFISGIYRKFVVLKLSRVSQKTGE